MRVGNSLQPRHPQRYSARHGNFGQKAFSPPRKRLIFIPLLGLGLFGAGYWLTRPAVGAPDKVDPPAPATQPLPPALAQGPDTVLPPRERQEVPSVQPPPAQNLDAFPLDLALRRPPVALPLPEDLQDFSVFLQQEGLSPALFTMLDQVYGHRDGRFDLPEDLQASFRNPVGKELLLRYFGPGCSEESLQHKISDLFAAQDLNGLYQPTPQDYAQGALVNFGAWWQFSPQRRALEKTAQTFLPAIFAQLAREKMENEVFTPPPSLRNDSLRPLKICLEDLSWADLQQGPWFLGDVQRPISIDSFRGFLWALERASQKRGFDPLQVYSAWILDMALRRAEILMMVPPNLDEQGQLAFVATRNQAMRQHFETITKHYGIHSLRDPMATSLTWQLINELEQFGMSRSPFAFSDSADLTARLFWSDILSHIKHTTRSGNQQYFFTASAQETRFGLHATDYRIEFTNPRCSAQGVVFFHFDFQSPTLMAQGSVHGDFKAIKTEAKQTDDAVRYTIERFEIDATGENTLPLDTPLEWVTVTVEVEPLGANAYKTATHLEHVRGKPNPFDGK